MVAARNQSLIEANGSVFAARAAGVRPEGSDVQALNAASRRAPAAALLLWAGERAERSWERAGVDAGDSALAAIAQDAIALVAGPDGEALRACEGPRCVQFLLRGQPRREFCSDGCATRARAARYYARRRAAVTRGPAARRPSSSSSRLSVSDVGRACVASSAKRPGSSRGGT